MAGLIAWTQIDKQLDRRSRSNQMHEVRYEGKTNKKIISFSSCEALGCFQDLSNLMPGAKAIS